MSIHRSLRGLNTLVGERSVLTRVERIEKLKKAGKFDTTSSSPLGLPKVRVKFRVAGAKKAKAEKTAEGAAAPGGAAAAPAAAPAADAAKGKGKADKAAKGKGKE